MYFLQNIHYLQKKIISYEKNININLFFFSFLVFFVLQAFFTENEKIYMTFEKYFFIQKIHIHSAKKFFLIIKNISLLKLRVEHNDLVLKVSEAPNMLYSLN